MWRRPMACERLAESRRCAAPPHQVPCGAGPWPASAWLKAGAAEPRHAKCYVAQAHGLRAPG
jgi:hypothetical protein